MSYSPSQHQLGRFGLCSAVWDPNKNQFREATEPEVMWCCLESAKKTAKTCLDECNRLYGPKKGNFKDYTDCRSQCARIILSSENTCALSFPEIWRGNSPLLGCITDFGCGKYPNYDQECIRKNKDGLIRCCNKDCVPTSTLSCNDHCRLKYYDLAGETKDPLLQIFNDHPKYISSDFSTHESLGNKAWIWYLVGVGVSIILIVALVLILKK